MPRRRCPHFSNDPTAPASSSTCASSRTTTTCSPHPSNPATTKSTTRPASTEPPANSPPPKDISGSSRRIPFSRCSHNRAGSLSRASTDTHTCATSGWNSSQSATPPRSDQPEEAHSSRTAAATHRDREPTLQRTRRRRNRRSVIGAGSLRAHRLSSRCSQIAA